MATRPLRIAGRTKSQRKSRRTKERRERREREGERERRERGREEREREKKERGSRMGTWMEAGDSKLLAGGVKPQDLK